MPVDKTPRSGGGENAGITFAYYQHILRLRDEHREKKEALERFLDRLGIEYKDIYNREEE